VKKFKILICLWALTIVPYFFSASAQSNKCDLNAIDQELLERSEKEQAIRRDVIPIVQEYQQTGEGTFKVVRLALKMNRIDKNNQKYLEKLINKCGWDSNLSSESHAAIFLIIDHADIEFINKYIHMVKEKALAGVLEPGNYPTVLDRKLMYEGKPQLFGTQTVSGIGDDNDINYVWPIADSENLTARRDSVSLPSMEKYFEMAMDEFNIKMVWDKTITIEQALEMKEE